MYVAYEIIKSINIIDYATLEHFLFGAVTLTKNSDIDRYKYSGYGIKFDRHGSFSFCNGVGRNVIIFREDMSSSTKIDNRKKYVFTLGKGPTQGLEHPMSAIKSSKQLFAY